VANAPSAADEVHQAELRDVLRTALSRIRPRAAEVFALRYFEGFDNQEIADMLGTTSGTIAVTLSRTRERLQEILRELEGVGP
jgi:RNA polymerase sigma-70 factor (ECF subfamily)|tara:strand:- start:456 stop:704 length:249 start_codon:yes stop_codon:yes gene_type:complete